MTTPTRQLSPMWSRLVDVVARTQSRNRDVPASKKSSDLTMPLLSLKEAVPDASPSVPTRV
jgi:hypothetical protein